MTDFADRVRVYPPEQSPVDFAMRPGSIGIGSLSSATPEQARAFAAAILTSADRLEQLNAEAGLG